eukprot:6771443-Prymnesium_polylepis.1
MIGLFDDCRPIGYSYLIHYEGITPVPSSLCANIVADKTFGQDGDLVVACRQKAKPEGGRARLVPGCDNHGTAV